MKLTVVIVSYNTKRLLLNCLHSLLSHKGKYAMEVWVVDNASSDGSVAEVLDKFPEVNLIQNKKNLGFAAANNQVLRQGNCDYYLLLNSDTEIVDDALDQLICFMEKSDFGICSCKLISQDRTFQPNAGDLPFGWSLFLWLSGLDDLLFFSQGKLPSFHQQKMSYYTPDREVGWVSGSVMMVRYAVLKKVGFLDESIFMYGEDTDFCIRAKKAGFKVGWTDSATIVHLGGGSSQNPSFKQWLGEFKGLLYIYHKYAGTIGEFTLRILIYIFVATRAVIFLLLGKVQVSRTYGKVLLGI